MEKLLVLSTWASLAVSQFGSIPLAQPGQLVPMDSCAHVVDCFGTYPLRPGHTRDEFPGTSPQPPRIIPGYVVPNYTIGPGDENCPSGNCIPIDPTNICNAYSPDCLPGVNVHQPTLKCDPKHHLCPPNGFLVTPNVACHPASRLCPPGGVITTPQYCKPDEHCPCGCGTYLPPWFTQCRQDNQNCPNGIKVTNPPVWPIYPVNEGYIPGWPWNPNNICDHIWGGHCSGDEIIVPTHPKDECDARKPGCIPKENIKPDTPPCDPRDPKCPNGNCVLVPHEGCHPNDPHPPPGCVSVNPIPCTAGTPRCPNDVEIPPLVNTCKAGTPWCLNGFVTPDRPTVKPQDPVIPPRNPRLTLDPNGSQRCSFVETRPIPDGKIRPEECKDREADYKPHFYGNSKFPCTRDDKNPAHGETVHDWMTYWVRNMKSTSRPFKFAEDTILQIVGSGVFDTRWTVKLDGKEVGTTDLGIIDPSRNCGSTSTDKCIKENAPHGNFFIPAGYHNVEWELLQPSQPENADRKYTADYRFVRVARCLPDSTKDTDRPDDSQMAPPQISHAVSPNPPSVEPEKVEDVTVYPPQPGNPPPQQVVNPPQQEHELPSRDPPVVQDPPQQQLDLPPRDPPVVENPPQQQNPPPQQGGGDQAAEPPQQQNPPPQQGGGSQAAEPPAQQTPAQAQTPGYKDFPCTEDVSWPCRGAELQKWDNMWFKWTGEYRRPGPPAPWVKEINYPDDTIFTLTDVENYVEHFEVVLDGKSIGETEEGDQHPFPDRWRPKCGHGEPERCMKDGWSHGFFRIPKGPHSLSIKWTKGDFNNWVYATGMYRFDAMCTC